MYENVNSLKNTFFSDQSVTTMSRKPNTMPKLILQKPKLIWLMIWRYIIVLQPFFVYCKMHNFISFFKGIILTENQNK